LVKIALLGRPAHAQLRRSVSALVIWRRKSLLGLIRAPTPRPIMRKHHRASAALLARHAFCTSLRTVFHRSRGIFSLSDRTRHEPVDAACNNLSPQCTRPAASCTRDHWGRQWGDRELAACSRRLPAADRGANSLRRRALAAFSFRFAPHRRCIPTPQSRWHKAHGRARPGCAGGHRSGWPRRDGGTA